MDAPDNSSSRGTRVSLPLRWIETLIITGFCFALGAWNQPDDPFYITGNFPWPMVGPILVALRYGFFMALVSSILIVAGLGFYLRFTPGIETAFPLSWAVGVLGLSLVAGEFRDYWERRRSQLEASNAYRESRLDEFTRSYYLLKVSHDRLEQQLAGSSRSLREALRRLYSELDDDIDPGISKARANAMLQLLVRYGQLQTAAIYPIEQGKPLDTPLASVGKVSSLPLQDPLLQHALIERKLISIQTEYRSRQADMDTPYLAVIPMIDADGHFQAICAIEAMPFFNFESKTLRFLAILAGHMADMISEQDASVATEDVARRSFNHHLARVARDAEQHQLPSALLSLRMPVSIRSQQVSEHIKRIRRGLDLIYETEADNRHHIMVLMPLTDELGLAGYVQRLEDEFRAHLGIHLNDDEFQLRTLRITQRDQAEIWVEEALRNGH